MPTHETTISDLLQDDHNANAGTDRGREMVAFSLQAYGAGRSVVVDKNNRLIAGNKTVEAAAAIGMDDVIVVPSDGTKLIVVQRTDLDLDTDLQARELAVADNRASEVGLAWNPEELRLLSEQGANIGRFFDDKEFAELLPQVTPDFEAATSDEQGQLDQKDPVKCPSCGHEFIPIKS